MSLEDLEDAGVTLPPEQWGKYEVRSHINSLLFVSALVVEVLSCIGMYWGDGSLLTWVGAVMFLISSVALTAILLRSTSAQRRPEPD